MRVERRPCPRGRRAVILSTAIVLLVLPVVGGTVLVKDNLYAVKAMNDTEAWAVGNFGSIYHTKDGGKTWDARDSGSKNPLFGVDFADATHGWAVGKSALIVHTEDGGATWRAQESAIPADKHLFAIDAVDANTAWVVGDWGAIASTHDGGATWVDRSREDDVVLYNVVFPDHQHGFIAGEFGTVLATTNGGETWEKRDVGTEKTLFGLSFSTPEKGWVVGIDGLILRTRDGGRTWDVQRGSERAENLDELGFMETIKNPGFYDVRVMGQYGVVVGDTGSVLTTTDGGDSWTRYALPEKQRLVWMRGASLAGEHGFVVGANGFSATIDHGRVLLPGGGTATVSKD
jgi:photosystem II stability/assembly factor-like uncharacterized protein